MASYLAVVTLARKSGIPKDAVQNSFAFQRSDVGGPIVDGVAIHEAVQNFYNVIPTGGSHGAITALLGQSLSTAADAGTFKLYDIGAHLAGGAHGSPVYEDTFTITATGATELPDEMAVALSFHSDYGSDAEFGTGARPRARDRGRVFLGPLAQTAMTQDATTKEPFVDITARDTIARAAGQLLAAGVGWSVWSRKSAALKNIVGGWVDNAFDVQRRRGNEATLRTAWDDSGPL